MQREPGFPVANCSIKLPDSLPVTEGALEEEEPVHRRQQLINFGHSQWGFNNWSWAVTKQELDFVEISRKRKYIAGVAAFVSVTVKSLDIYRENVGYATSEDIDKGTAIHRSRKSAVTNALRETLLSFGGNVATELMEQLELHKTNDIPNQTSEPLQENNQNITNKVTEPKNLKQTINKDFIQAPVPNPVVPVKNVVNPPVAKAHPMPANLPPVNRGPPANAPRPPAPPTVRPNSNERSMEELSEEEARAERKRRQRQAEEEFRMKHLTKLKDDNQDLDKNNSLEVLMMAIPTQDEIENTSSGNTEMKRKSPVQEECNKRRSVMNRIDLLN